MIRLPIPPQIQSPADPAYVQILRSARALLWDGCSDRRDGIYDHVCTAVAAAQHPDVEEVLEEIHQRLDGSPTLGRWMQRAGVYRSSVSARAMQDARLRWIDQLIGEFGSSAMVEFPIPPREIREENPAFVEILRGARQLLWGGAAWAPGMNQYRYICRAISHSTPNREHGEVLIHEIGDTIGYHRTYESWLGMQRCTTKHFYGTGFDFDMAVQDARRRWVNQLIEEYGGVP